jgi:nitrate/nitrite transport system substrate-binding protein
MSRILSKAAVLIPAALLLAQTPEVQGVKLGFIPLTDCAPLVVAKEKGLFAKHGMPEVEVVKQASWAATRDNLELGGARGGIDGAHILTPMVYQLSLGIGTKGGPVPMQILSRLNANAQSISAENASPGMTVSNANAIKGKNAKLAMTYPGGTHDLWIRYWLAANGLDPDKDVNLMVVPPPQMVANMKVGNMDAFCVGEPWGQQLIDQKLGYTVTTTQEIWRNHPEKSLGLRKDWVDAHPAAALALLEAVQEAQIWCENPANKAELAQILSSRNWIGAPAADLLPRLKGDIVYGDSRPGHSNDPMLFWNNHVGFPYKSHDKWFLAEMRRWGFFPKGVDYDKVVASVNRSDLWRKAAAAIGHAADAPASDSRGVETFFDGVKFDPANPEAYLASLKIKHLTK